MIFNFDYELQPGEIHTQTEDETLDWVKTRAWADLSKHARYLLTIKKDENHLGPNEKFTGRVVVLHETQYVGIMKMLSVLDCTSANGTKHVTDEIRRELKDM